MGKGSKKRFIPKGEGQQYFLLHRSSTDTAHLGEAPPSQFVLVQADDVGNQRDIAADSVNALSIAKLKSSKDHVTTLGFKNDGYDYSQHLKEIGGGNYIGKDGKMSQLPATARKVELPQDALPSGSEFERQLEAITISNEFMDEDLRKALFEDVECEELADDFISSAMEEPEKPDFDYDAHIAMLIARSEGLVTSERVAPRGWEEEDEDEDVSSYEGSQEDESRIKSHPAVGVSSEYMKRIEEQFELTLEDYGDENIGDLEDEVDEEDLQGTIDFNDPDNELESALDEFLQDSLDHQYVDGVVTYEKGSRVIHDTAPLSEEELVQRMKEFVLESTENLAINEVTAEQEYNHMMLGQEYLREEREYEQWDCETILTTYSTLDNHPSVIQKERKHKKGSSDAGSVQSTSGAEGKFYSRGTLKAPTQQQHIALGGKYMLPKETNQRIKDKKKKTQMAPIESESESESESDSEAEEVENGDDANETEEKKLKREKPKSLRQKETPEEKKLRKQQVKDSRREKRATKKGLKSAFKGEEVRVGRIVGHSQDIDRVSVFKY